MTDAIQAPTKRARASHIFAPEAEGHYVDPSWCSLRLFEVEFFVGSIWDPCCGFGTIVESARTKGLASGGSDIVDRGYKHASAPADFLKSKQVADNIVCNPPFHLPREFVAQALSLARRKVAMILPVRRLNAAHWIEETPLCQIWLLTPRPSMPPGSYIAAGHKPGGGTVDYCWAVWRNGWAGRREIGWLHRDGASE